MQDRETQTVNIDLLTQVGQCLYGDQWQSNLARALEIDPRRVRQWINAERPLPDWLTKELINLLDQNIKQGTELKKILTKLKK